jgi:hypothetical protein
MELLSLEGYGYNILGRGYRQGIIHIALNTQTKRVNRSSSSGLKNLSNKIL